MTGKSLLNDILKYTSDKNVDSNGNVISYDIKPYSQAVATGNKIVKTYTFGDIYNLSKGAYKEGESTISTIKSSIKNVIPALAALGYTALNPVLTTMEKLLTSAEALRGVMKIYRTVKPIVDNAANIGEIVWNFAMISKILQTVVQAVAKLAIAVAFAAIEQLWKSILAIPICSIFETVEESEGVVEYSDLQNEMIEESLEEVNDLLRELNTDEIIRITNDYLINKDGNFKSNFSFNIDSCIAEIENTITQVAYDKKQNVLYVADTTNIYKINYDSDKKEHSTEKVDTLGSTTHFFVYDGTIYKPTINYTGLFYSANDTFGYLNNKIYNAKTNTEILSIDSKYSIVTAAYDENTANDMYCIAKDSTNIYYLIKICKQDSVYTNTVYYVASAGVELSNLVYFNGKLYVVKKENNKYSINTISANHTLDKISFNYNKAIKYIDNSTSDNYKYITSGKNIAKFNYNKLINNYTLEASDITTTCSNLIANAMSVSYCNYNGTNYYICPCGYGLIISNANQESWVLRDIGNNSSEVNEIENDSSTIYSGCFWYNNNFYFYTPKRIFRITDSEKADLFTGNDTIVTQDLSPNIRAPQTDAEKWNNDEPMTIMDNLNYHDSVPISNISSTALIEKVKVINNVIYVSITDTETASNSGIYKLESNFSTFTKVSTVIVPTTDDGNVFKIYSFDYINNQWYVANSTSVYCYYGSTPVELAIDINDDAISSIEHYTKTSGSSTTDYIIIYLLKSILLEKPDSNLTELTSYVKIDSSKEITLARSQSSLVINNNSNTYNIVYNTNVDNLPFQTLSVNNDAKLIQVDYGVAFIDDTEIHGNAVGTSVKDMQYHTGYNIDTSFTDWKGCAPYFLSTNTLRNELNNIPRADFIAKFKNSFKIDSEKLFTIAPTAVIEYLRNELKKSLAVKLKNRMIEDTEDEDLIAKLKAEGKSDENIIDTVSTLIINAVTEVCVSYVNTYLTKAFSAKLQSGDIFSNFAEETYKLCLSDKDNDLTKDFYTNMAILLQDTTQSAMDDCDEIDLANSCVSYYQNHKHEWADDGYPENMYAEVLADTVEYSKYKANIETKTFILDDAKFHTDFYNNIKVLYEPPTGKTYDDELTDEDKAEIIFALENSIYKVIPSADWQSAISSALTDYKSAQADQYRYIVDSNSYGMYPLKTEELPERINIIEFDAALSTLLTMVREEIKKKIYILVDEGNVKCYSCVDNSSIIENIINESMSIYKKQCKSLIPTVETEGITWGELKTAIDGLTVISKNTSDILQKLLNDQSKLYAKYLVQIIYKEAIDIGKDVYADENGNYIIQEGTKID